MNNLLLFFAFPIATIILSIVAQKVLKNTILTTLTFFAIYLVLTFSAFDINFLIYAIAYTILAYITATIVEFIIRRMENNNENGNNNDDNCLCRNYDENEKYLRNYCDQNYGVNTNKNCYFRR